MGVKKQMDTFFASLGEQTGRNGRLVNTPMGPFRWNDVMELWENINNGMVLNNISFMDEFAMMDYSSVDGGADIPGNRITVLEFDFTTGVLPSVFTFYRNSIGTFVNSDGYLDYSKDNILPNTVFSGATGTTVPTNFGAINTGSNTFSLNNKELTFRADVSAARFFISPSPALTVIPGVPYTLQCKVVAVNLTGNSKRLNEVIGWAGGQLAGSDIYKVNGIQQTNTYTGWTAGDLLSFTSTPASTTNAIFPRLGLGVSSQAPTLNDFLTIKEPQFEAGVNARTYIENTASYPYYGPRFTFDSLTRQPIGLLIEGRGVNFAPNNYSETMVNYGSGSQVGATSGNTADPFGGTGAVKLFAQNITGVKARNCNFTMTNIATIAAQGNSYGDYPFTISVFARPNNYSKLSITDANNGWVGATYDLITGSASALPGSPSTGWFGPNPFYGTTAYTIPHVGINGITWWRCVLAVPKGNSGTIMGLGFAGYTAESTILSRYGATYIGSGNVNDGIYIFGPQFELGYGASSFMPTGSTGSNTPTASDGITRESDAAQIKDISPYNVSNTNNSLYIQAKLNKSTSNIVSYTTLWGLYSDSDSKLTYDILTYPLFLKFATRVQGNALNVGGSEEPGAGIYANFVNSNVKIASSMSVGNNQISFFSINGVSASATHANTGDTASIPSRLVLGQPVGNSAALPYSPPNNRDNLSMVVSALKYYNYTLGNTAVRDLTL